MQLVADDRHCSSFLVLAFRALRLLAPLSDIRYNTHGNNVTGSVRCVAAEQQRGVLLGLGSHTSVGSTKFAVTSQPTGQAGHILEAAS